ncbi:hypothetical protein Ddye_001744 [Dipteronia dyeriana]|uniref:Uncharacterized protein n=1 Tax=Dipteronia dyeriana TaxID=168575 RepID=A0AAD9XPU5_9ROSI|nr:hypothetical protein Ddye_001744 [Dipteronia dyeriana]
MRKLWTAEIIGGVVFVVRVKVPTNRIGPRVNLVLGIQKIGVLEGVPALCWVSWDIKEDEKDFCFVIVDVTKEIDERDLATGMIQPFVVIRSIPFVADIGGPKKSGMWVVTVGPAKNPNAIYLGGRFWVHFPKMAFAHEFGKFGKSDG